MSVSYKNTVLSLYKRLYRLHSTQNEPFKSLSNTYLKMEFRAIRDMGNRVTKQQWDEFIQQWTRYESQLLSESMLRKSNSNSQSANASSTKEVSMNQNLSYGESNPKSDQAEVDSDILDWGQLNPEQRQKVLEMQKIFKK